MKNILLIWFCFLSLSITAQSDSKNLLTETEWINKDLNYMRFDDSLVVSNFDNVRQEMIYDLENKKLTFKVNYRVGPDARTETFDFKIKELKKNKLVIEPMKKKEEVSGVLKKINYEPFFEKKQYIFYNRGLLRSTVNFKKITFHSSTCFGTCSSMSVQINVNGDVFYQGRKYVKNIGNFVGKLSDKDMIELKKILNRSRLYDIEAKWSQKTEAKNNPRYNYLIQDFAGNNIELNTTNQHPILDKLADFFLEIENRIELSRSPGKYKFDQSKDKKYQVLLY